MKTLWNGQSLKRAVGDGRAVGAVALEDYAYVTHGLLEWSRLTNESRDYAQARDVARVAWERFYSKNGWQLSEQRLIQMGKGEDAVTDGPMPSPSAVLIAASLALAEKLGDDALRRQAQAAQERGRGAVRQDPFWHATHAALLAVKTVETADERR